MPAITKWSLTRCRHVEPPSDEPSAIKGVVADPDGRRGAAAAVAAIHAGATDEEAHAAQSIETRQLVSAPRYAQAHQNGGS